MNSEGEERSRNGMLLEHEKVELEIREMLAPRPSSLEIPAFSVFKIVSDLI